MKLDTFWKLLLVSSILVAAFGLFALSNLGTNIIGDGIPNKPQSTRIWDQGMQIISIVVISILTGIYSGIKILR